VQGCTYVTNAGARARELATKINLYFSMVYANFMRSADFFQVYLHTPLHPCRRNINEYPFHVPGRYFDFPQQFI